MRVGHIWGVCRMWRQQEGKLIHHCKQVEKYELSKCPDSFEYYHFHPHVSHSYHSKHGRIKQCISCVIFVQTELWIPSDHQACLSSSVIWYSAAFVCLTWGKSWTNAPCLSLRWHKTPEEQWRGYFNIQKLCFCISPTCSLVFLSAAWMRWSISSSISLSCIDAWSCALQDRNRIISQRSKHILPTAYQLILIITGFQ